MRKTNWIRVNRKRQNGRTNPIWGKEFTPNGGEWIGYDDEIENTFSQDLVKEV